MILVSSVLDCLLLTYSFLCVLNCLFWFGFSFLFCLVELMAMVAIVVYVVCGFAVFAVICCLWFAAFVVSCWVVVCVVVAVCGAFVV